MPFLSTPTLSLELPNVTSTCLANWPVVWKGVGEHISPCTGRFLLASVKKIIAEPKMIKTQQSMIHKHNTQWVLTNQQVFMGYLLSKVIFPGSNGTKNIKTTYKAMPHVKHTCNAGHLMSRAAENKRSTWETLNKKHLRLNNASITSQHCLSPGLQKTQCIHPSQDTREMSR